MDLSEEIPYFADSTLGEGIVISLKNLNLSTGLSIIDKVNRNLIIVTTIYYQVI